MSTHRIETTELTDCCTHAEEGVRVTGEEEPEDKTTPAKNKKRDPGPDKHVFVTEPVPKMVKPASTSEGEEDPWCHVHLDGNHLLKDCRQVKGLTVRAQRQADGVGPGTCYSCGLTGHYTIRKSIIGRLPICGAPLIYAPQKIILWRMAVDAPLKFEHSVAHP